MIRFICRETDVGAACNAGGPVDVRHKTFTDAAELELWLRFDDMEHHKYTERTVLGVELIEEPDHA